MLTLFSCKQQKSEITVLQNHIDSLEAQLAEIYKPGFGQLMNTIQLHHSKLWFAGKNKNWKLAKFEIHELEETIEAILKYQPERNESQQIHMVLPDLNSLNSAIKQKNSTLFKQNYSQLTTTCNNCHRLVDHAYIVAKIPDISPYSNQDFKVANIDSSVSE